MTETHADLVRRSRATVETARPVCPACGARAERDATDWLRVWGHRCPHGEPCPGWGDPSEHVTECSVCRERGADRASNESSKPEEGERMAKPRGALYTHEGETKGQAEWARDPRNTAGLDASVIGQRLRQGWTVADALSLPKGSPRPGGSKDKNRSTPTPAKKKPAQKRSRSAPAAPTAPGLGQIDEEIARVEAWLVELRRARHVLDVLAAIDEEA